MGIERLTGRHELRWADDARSVAVGSLACPGCDAPVLPTRALSPSAPLACPYCGHAGPARDFLSLGEPTRPARVVVHLARRR